MNWRSLDLNLIVVFDAVMQERNATRAAERLKINQSAVSRALTRLRSALGDELFIRTPDGMEPTPYATRLAQPARKALADLRAALEGAEPFAPDKTERTFKVLVNNHAALVLAPTLAATVQAEAPGVSLDLRPSGTLDVPDALDRGDIDLALGALAAPAERFSDMRLLEEGFAAVVRYGHPAITADGSMAVSAIAGTAHLEVSSTGEGTQFVDDELASLGRARRIALRAPLHSTAALLTQSDMVAVMTERTARQFARNAPLKVLSLPFASPRVATAMLWHRRLDSLEAHRWLRSLVLRVARTL